VVADGSACYVGKDVSGRESCKPRQHERAYWIDRKPSRGHIRLDVAPLRNEHKTPRPHMPGARGASVRSSHMYLNDGPALSEIDVS
jgi:hypothetical protein